MAQTGTHTLTVLSAGNLDERLYEIWHLQQELQVQVSDVYEASLSFLFVLGVH